MSGRVVMDATGLLVGTGRMLDDTQGASVDFDGLLVTASGADPAGQGHGQHQDQDRHHD